jgi:hypothetical protein
MRHRVPNRDVGIVAEVHVDPVECEHLLRAETGRGGDDGDGMPPATPERIEQVAELDGRQGPNLAGTAAVAGTTRQPSDVPGDESALFSGA